MRIKIVGEARHVRQKRFNKTNHMVQEEYIESKKTRILRSKEARIIQSKVARIIQLKVVRILR